MHYLLFYDVEADFIQKRALYRTEHLALAWRAHEKESFFCWGLGRANRHCGPSVPRCITGGSRAVCDRRSLCQKRPRQNWRVRQWNTVAGESAANPVRVNPRSATRSNRRL